MSTVTKEDLQRAIRSADSKQPVPSGRHRQADRRLLFAPIAAVIVIASLALLMRQLNPPPSAVEDTASVGSESTVTPAASGPDSSPFALEEAVAAVASGAVPNNSQGNAGADDAAAAAIAEEPVIEQVPVTDSNLALVTAQQRGISAETIAEPEFEQLAAEPEATNARDQLQLSIANEPVPVRDSVQLANVTLTRPMLALDDEEIEEVIPPRPENTPSRGSAELPVTFASTASRAQAMVQSWVEAWEGQDLEQYFASYAPEFVPRYHRNRSQWRGNRERVIGNASQISLELSDFEVVDEDAQTVEVHFWLAYRSPSYQDETRKKLVLKKLSATASQAARLVILEEVNLEVRV